MSYYCYPKLGPSGLGNCLFVWARAFVFAQRHGCKLLAPQWVQPRLGSIIRREPVTRFYTGEFTNKGYVHGLRKWLILSLAQRIPESRAANLAPAAGKPNGAISVVVFEGLGDYFTCLIPHRGVIAAELQRVAHPFAVARAESVSARFIAVHVRRGDLTRQKIPVSQILQYTPTEWFVSAIQTLRADEHWKHLPVKIISDGDRGELREILELPGCELMTTGKAVGDILLLARADLLVASGYSTFSMWASFLGEMPTLYAPGKMQQNLFTPKSKSFEGEWNPGQPLPKFDVE
jgi:hypothetical protein